MSKLPLAFVVILFIPSVANARLWTDSTGRYTIEADFVAFNDKSVIIERPTTNWARCRSKNCRQPTAITSNPKKPAKLRRKHRTRTQTWTMRSGLKVVGRVVGYARKQMTLQRRRGNIYVNDRLFGNLPKIYQAMIPKIAAHFEQLVRDDEQALEDWFVTQKGPTADVHGRWRIV